MIVVSNTSPLTNLAAIEEFDRAAQRLGLRIVGVIGILLQAKAEGKIDLVRSRLDALRQRAGFYLSESVYQHALALAGEK